MEEKYRKIYLQNVNEFFYEFNKDSAYLINRFLNGYSKDKMRNILKVIEQYSGSGNNSTMEEWIKSSVKSYKPINPQYIDMLKYFSLYMSEQTPLTETMTVWRGCDSLEDGAMTGLVATSTQKKIAEGFNYGTLLKINLPVGMRVVKNSDFSDELDIEKQVILPPCEYEIKSEKNEIINGRSTRIVEIDVEPRDLLRDFAIAMQTPEKDYITENGIDDNYKTAYFYLNAMLAQRTILNCVLDEKMLGTSLQGGIDNIKRDNMYQSKNNNKTNMNYIFSLMNSDIELPPYIEESVNNRVLRDKEIPVQITKKQFFETINNSENKNIFEDYKNAEEHEKYYMYKDHGIRHADNVTMFAYYIASKEGYTDDGIRIIMEAARYHDIGRTNCGQEFGHGLAGAKKYAENYRKQLPLYEQQIVGFLIQAHDLPKKEDIKVLANQVFKYCGEQEIEILCDMANIVRDADALDRTRFPIFSADYLDCRLLTHNSSKELISVAQTINYIEDKQRGIRNKSQEKNIRIRE